MSMRKIVTACVFSMGAAYFFLVWKMFTEPTPLPTAHPSTITSAGVTTVTVGGENNDLVLPPENLKQESIVPPPGVAFNGPRLGDIPVGTTVWIEPWTVWVASPGDGLPNKTFINGYHNYYTSPKPHTLKVTRENGDWLVDLQGSTQEWTAMKFPGIIGGGYDSQPVRFRH